MDYNSVTIVGRLTSDPEEQHKQDGERYARFSVAVGDRGGKTDFFRVTAFGRLAETLLAHKHKGDEVLISGRLSQRTYTRDDGSKGESISIVARDVRFGRNAGGGRGQDGAAGEDSGGQPDVGGLAGEVPF